MDKSKKNKKWYTFIIDFFKNIFLTIYYIFYFAFIGLKACTFDIFVNIYNGASWRLDKAYKRSREVIGSPNFDGGEKKKKAPKVYKYSAKKLAKLDKLRNEMMKDLQTTGATRSKEVNVYRYIVMDKNGRLIKGQMNGLSKLDINAFLINEGYKVYDIQTSPMINFLYKESFLTSNKMSTKELIFWLTQLSTYLKAGITLNDSIKILTKQMKRNKAKARALESISYELALGSSFSVALEKQGNMFPALLINMIKAAESSGTLIETLDDMANYYTEVDETRKQMKSAMTYPLIVTVFAFAVILFILIFIIPEFIKIYDQNDIDLNGLTAFIINVSHFLKDNVVVILAFIVLVIVILVVAYKNVKAFRKSMQVLLMHMPVIKNIIIYNELAIFTKTFASLLRNNVFITESIDILSKITNNEVYKNILYHTINNIVKGDKISDAFKDHWAVPDVAYFMIVTGESTGELDKMMQKVSDYYQGLHKGLVDNLKDFIEPVLIAFLAVVVGLIIISVILPMFEVYKDIGDL